MKISSLVLISAVTAVLAGCQGKPSLAGDWTATAAGAAGQSQTFMFQPGNKVALKSNMMGVDFTVSGSYKEEPTTLVITPAMLDAPGLDPAMLKQAKAAFETSKTPINFKLAWVGADEVTLTPTNNSNPAIPSTPLTLKRLKK